MSISDGSLLCSASSEYRQSTWQDAQCDDQWVPGRDYMHTYSYVDMIYRIRVKFGSEINLTVGGPPAEPPLIMSANNDSD